MRGLAFLLAVCLAGCATGYHASNLAGGFQQTRLGDGVFQVRFRGNGMTSPDTASNYVLRRCAELTLESGSRYFEIGGMSNQTTTAVIGTGVSVTSVQTPSSEAVLRILPPGATTGLDAVTIVQETDEAADGELSDAARVTFRRYLSQSTALAHK